MTIIIVGAVLFGFLCIGGALLIRKVRRDMERQQANILALQSRTASIKQADRQRMHSAMTEDRGLVSKLRVALVNKQQQVPVARARDDRGLVRKLHLALVETPPQPPAVPANEDHVLAQKLLAAFEDGPTRKSGAPTSRG